METKMETMSDRTAAIPQAASAAPISKPRRSLEAIVVASPPHVATGSPVELIGYANKILVDPDGEIVDTDPVAYQWSLFFRPPGGNTEEDVTSILGNSARDRKYPFTIHTAFTPIRAGTYRAQITAIDRVLGSARGNAEITASLMRYRDSTAGVINDLSVREVDLPPFPDDPSNTNPIDTEAIVNLANQPEGKPSTFGFQLRNDKNRPAHQAMYDLLRDAFNSHQPVIIDYTIASGNHTGEINRVTLVSQGE